MEMGEGNSDEASFGVTSASEVTRV